MLPIRLFSCYSSYSAKYEHLLPCPCFIYLYILMLPSSLSYKYNIYSPKNGRPSANETFIFYALIDSKRQTIFFT